MGDTTEERIFNSESNELSLDRICELMPKVVRLKFIFEHKDMM
jgi:hypothetical protein